MHGDRPCFNRGRSRKWIKGRVGMGYYRYYPSERYYFAGRYSSHPAMRLCRDQLTAAIPEAVVTSRWIDCHGGQYQESFSIQTLAADPVECWGLGEADLQDIDRADVLVAFSDEGGKGGRHVEFGYALANGKRLVLIGHRENVFHTHPDVEQYDTWEEFLKSEVGADGDATGSSG